MKRPNEKQFQPEVQDRHHPFNQFEYVDVSFGAADTDTPVYYEIIRPNAASDIRFLDITQGAVYTGGSDTIPKIYLSNSPSRMAPGTNYFFLRSTIANYMTRLLLFVEL